MDSIIKLDLPEKCRIITVSDIHTCCDLLDSMLKKANYNPDKDYLIIVGDILEHWSNNINTLNYIYELNKNDKVYCLLGNNDTFAARMAFTYSYEKFAQKFNYQEYGVDNCFLQMAKSTGYDNCNKENWLEIRKSVLSVYGKKLKFLNDLPVCLETDKYVFVHAGLENRPDWKNTNDNYAITVPWFLRKENPTDKWLVVGHFPTYNYKRSKATNLPIIDNNKKIIAIDGGLSIKSACQMNLFIIEKDGENYTHRIVWDTPFEKKTVKEDFSCNLKPVYVDWSNQDMIILDEKNGIVHLHDNVTGNEGFIPKREVYEFDGAIHVYQFLSSFPSVQKGEQVYFCNESNDMALVITKEAVVGWLPKTILE